MSATKRYLTTGDVAKQAGVSAETVRHWHERGLLVPVGIGQGKSRLYEREDVERFLRDREDIAQVHEGEDR